MTKTILWNEMFVMKVCALLRLTLTSQCKSEDHSPKKTIFHNLKGILIRSSKNSCKKFDQEQLQIDIG